MSFEGLWSFLGLGDLLGEDVFAIQMSVLTVTVLLFICSFIVCLMAFRAAGAARRARSEAEAHFRSAQDLAVEVRHLTAQVEKATHRRSAAAAASSPIRVGASETPDEAEIEIISAPAEDPSADERLADEANGRTLEEAKKAATIPSALLGRFRRGRA
jgi:biopolymer transport protein ExbB/TolQ